MADKSKSKNNEAAQREALANRARPNPLDPLATDIPVEGSSGQWGIPGTGAVKSTAAERQPVGKTRDEKAAQDEASRQAAGTKPVVTTLAEPNEFVEPGRIMAEPEGKKVKHVALKDALGKETLEEFLEALRHVPENEKDAEQIRARHEILYQQHLRQV